jgi:hypothetical protein
VVFLGVAIVQIWLPPAQSKFLIGIYGIVALVLGALAGKSGPRWERLYFICCFSSASLGLAGQVLGGAILHSVAYPRALLLTAAAVTGFAMLRRRLNPSA